MVCQFARAGARASGETLFSYKGLDDADAGKGLFLHRSPSDRQPPGVPEPGMHDFAVVVNFPAQIGSMGMIAKA